MHSWYFCKVFHQNQRICFNISKIFLLEQCILVGKVVLGGWVVGLDDLRGLIQPMIL